jgi:hypothetical protein
MAYAFQNYEAFDAAAFAAFNDNRCLLLPENPLASAPTGNVRWTQTGNTTDADESNTSFPASRSFDEFLHKKTQPDSGIVGASAVWYLVVDFGAVNLQTIDAGVIVHNNLGSLGITVDLQIADDAIFFTNLKTIATSGVLTAPASGKLEERVAFYSLDHGVGVQQIYTSVRFLRYKFSRVGNFIPAILLANASARTQLIVNPLVPFDAEGNASNIATFASRGGADRVYVFNRGKGGFTANFRLADAAEIAPIEDAWFRSEQGTKHMIFATSPKDDPAESLLVHLDPADFFFPFEVSTRVRSGSWDFVEQGPPFVARER